MHKLNDLGHSVSPQRHLPPPYYERVMVKLGDQYKNKKLEDQYRN